MKGRVEGKVGEMTDSDPITWGFVGLYKDLGFTEDAMGAMEGF